MKKHLISFIHQPKKVIAASLVVAIIVGVWGYRSINKTRADLSSLDTNVSTVKNVSLSFPSSGKIKSVSVKAGDHVKRGDILAVLTPDYIDGALIQAQAAYEIAKANYQKIINGATGSAIDLAKAAVNTATVNLNETTKQQEVLVNNAYRTLLNSSLVVQSNSSNDPYDKPIVSGTYDCKKEGAYYLEIYNSVGGYSVNYSGLETGILDLTDVPKPLGSCGLFLALDKGKNLSSGAKFNIQIPNMTAANYAANNNAYQLALQTKSQATAMAEASLEQAKATLENVATSARGEDVAIAKAQLDNARGALIANAAYNNTVISAPGDGMITAVYITPDQIITSNVPAIVFLGLSN